MLVESGDSVNKLPSVVSEPDSLYPEVDSSGS